MLHLQPPHSELHWGATVSLEASRLLPSRLGGFLLPPPPTFNHLFTGVTQRKASPGGNTPNRLELGLFGGFLGVGCKSAGGLGHFDRRRCSAAWNFFVKPWIFERERQEERRCKRGGEARFSLENQQVVANSVGLCLSSPPLPLILTPRESLF